MRGLEFIPTDPDEGDVFEYTLPERHDPVLQRDLGWIAEDYYYGGEDYLADDYWE